MHIVPWLLLIALAGCKSKSAGPPTDSKAADQKAETKPADKLGGSPNNGETIIPPSPITGALLTCASIVPPAGVVASAEIGCRMSDNNGVKVDLSTSDAKVSYKPLNVPSGITVVQKNPSLPERNFDAIFDISSEDSVLLEKTLSNLTYQADLSHSKNNENLGVKTYDKHSLQIPVPRGDWLRKTEGGVPYFIDKTTTLTWAVDNGKSYNFKEATEHCDLITHAGATNWRVPSILELLSAHFDEIGTVFPQAENMNIDSRRFGGYVTTALTPDGFGSIFGIGNKQLSIDFSKPSYLGLVFGEANDQRSLICVHD